MPLYLNNDNAGAKWYSTLSKDTFIFGIIGDLTDTTINGISKASFVSTNNVFIGYGAGYNGSPPGVTNSVAIGYNAYTTKDNQVVLGNSSTTQTKLNGDVFLAAVGNGLILKDSASPAHYWRLTVNTSGVLETTDLGTTEP